MLSAQYPSSNQSTFTYNNENSPNFKRSLYEESSFRLRKKRCPDDYFNVETTQPFKRTFREEFTESDSHGLASPTKRSRLNGHINHQRVAKNQIAEFETFIEPRIIDITSGEVLEEVSTTSPHYTSNVTTDVNSKALVKHSKASPASQERLHILFNIPSNSEPHTQLPMSNFDQSIMQIIPYQPPSHHCQNSYEQPVYATLHEIEDDDSFENGMDVD